MERSGDVCLNVCYSSARSQTPNHARSRTLQRQTYGRTFIDMFPATAGLLMVNVAFFLLELILSDKLRLHEPDGGGSLDPHGEVLKVLGSSRTQEVLDGEVWRLVSSCYLHGGIMHVLMNMYVLAMLGRSCEPLLGTARFFATYVACGALAGVAAVGWRYYEGNPFSSSVGASGAVAGLVGLLLAFSLRHKDRMLRGQILQWIGFMVVISLVIQFGTRSIALDHAGHLGGLAAGFVFGLFVPPYVSSASSMRWKIPCGIAIAVTVVCLGMSLWTQYKAWQ